MSMMNLICMNLVIYLPFHLFEEAIGDFPKWMYIHKWLPYHMTHGHWMANNLFIYYPLLLISVIVYVLNRDLACFGLAIFIWGMINFCDHFFYTIKDRKVSPGLISGILFLVNSVLGLSGYMSSDAFSVFQLIMGIVIGGVLFGLPMGLCIVLYKFFDKYFK